MGTGNILDNLRREQELKGIVPVLDSMPTRYHFCGECGEKIERPYSIEPYVGKWRGPEVVYYHKACVTA
jgi:hypothetical protein